MKHIKLFENLIIHNELHYVDTAYGQIFWDQNNEIICGIHENDGRFRDEYMSVFLEHFGIEITHHTIIPDFVKEWESYDNYGY